MINIPPVWFRTVYVQWLLVLPLAWQGISLVLIWLIEAGMGWGWAIMNMPVVLLTPIIHQFVGLILWWVFFRSTASRIRIECTPESIRFKRWILGKIVHEIEGDRRRTDIEAAPELDCRVSLFALRRGRPITVCELRGEKFGFWLTEAEKAWITQEVNAFDPHEIPPG